MNFALITPSLGADMFNKNQLHYHMALAQKLMSDVAYLEMYKNMRRHANGDYIIVDNGAAENDRQPFDMVVRVANDIGADEIIMPDELRDSKRTLEMTLDTAARAVVPARKRMVVPQGRNYREWINCFMTMQSTMDFRSIGIAKHLEELQGGRYGLLEYLEDNNFHEKYDVHLLGMYGNAYTEIRPLVSRYPWIRGMDTAAPIAYAQEGRDLSSCVHFSLDWDKPFNEKLADMNVGTMVRICRGNQICTSY